MISTARTTAYCLIIMTAFILGCSLLSPGYEIGDVDHSGDVNRTDAQLILESLCDEGDTAIDTELADVSGDGTISAYDAALIMERVK